MQQQAIVALSLSLLTIPSNSSSLCVNVRLSLTRPDGSHRTSQVIRALPHATAHSIPIPDITRPKAPTQNFTTSQTPCMMHEAKAERMQILSTAGKRFASH
jgi:hypothetical protein